MATTKEQAEAYDYEARRQATTLVSGRDEARTDPRRRINRVTAAGVLVGVLVMAGFGIAGFLGAGRGPALPESGAVLVAGSGDRYVVVDGRLHPALNLASALLVGGGSVAQVRPVALDALPRGLPVGIPEAPDALPAPERLSTAPWTVCAVPSGAATLPPEVTVRVAAPEPAAGAVDAGQAVLATGPDGTRWMVNQGRRYRLADAAAQRVGLQRATPLALPAEILDLLPEGPPIAAPNIAGLGCPGGRGAACVGDRRRRAGPGRGDRPGEPRRAARRRRVGLGAHRGAAGVGGIERGRDRSRDGRHGTSLPHPSLDTPGWPEVVPQPVGPQRDQPLCLSTTPGAPAGDAPWPVRVSLPGVVLGPGEQAVHTGQGDTPGVVDQVMVPRGAGALVRATTASGGDGALTLVTDSGQRFAVPTPDAATRLRYDPAVARSVPAPFVRLLPAGPALDPEAAAREFTGR